MIIDISDSIRIAGKERCWELQKSRTRNNQKMWEPIKYYSGLQQALAAVGEREFRMSEGYGLANAVESLTDVTRRLQELLDDTLAISTRRIGSVERLQLKPPSQRSEYLVTEE